MLDVTPDLIRRFDRPGPRYTSYPTADRFHDGVGEAAYRDALARADASRPAAPLSIYVHLPFCSSLCTYCGCNVTITRNEAKKEAYLRRLFAEIDRVAELLPSRRWVAQLHLGGGTPNYYSDDQLRALIEHLERHFRFEADAERAIEVDPRHATPERMASLRALGFDRVSMGVQDFDPDVQAAVRRVSPFEDTRALVDAAREAGFQSLNLDLIYGLPLQRAETFAATIDKVLKIRPDRIALYSFAYVPWLRKQQRAIDPETLPTPDQKLQLFCDARAALLDAGYVAIGMDHFALPDDELARAQDSGQLRRNFQGYTTLDEVDVIGFGVSAIGDIGGAYVQNTRDVKLYEARVDAGHLPVERGLERTGEDAARRFVIHQLMCNFDLDAGQLRERFGLELTESFADELEELRRPELSELVAVDDDGLSVTPLGRLFVRNVAMVFDRHLRDRPAQGPAYSRTV